LTLRQKGRKARRRRILLVGISEQTIRVKAEDSNIDEYPVADVEAPPESSTLGEIDRPELLADDLWPAQLEMDFDTFGTRADPRKKMVSFEILILYHKL
jgi:hypothetical protein